MFPLDAIQICHREISVLFDMGEPNQNSRGDFWEFRAITMSDLSSR